MLNHKSTRSARLFWLGALLGAAVFLLVYGLAPLDVANDAFCRGGYIEKDIQQHYAGWLFYRSSAPGWPLGVTQAINAPQGVSVAYTDSIPLLAVLCRPLAAALGGTFQYSAGLPLSALLCQGGFAALLCGLFAEGLAAPFGGFACVCGQPDFTGARVPAHLARRTVACAGGAVLLFCLPPTEPVCVARIVCHQHSGRRYPPVFSAHDLRCHTGAFA